MSVDFLDKPQNIYDLCVIFLIIYQTFMFSFINRKLKKICNERHVFDLKSQMDTSKKVDNTLSELRALIDADRITLLRFHNGQEFLPNNPVWKLTGTNWVKEDGVSDEVINDLLISRIQPIIDPLITGETTDEAVKIPPPCENCVNSRTCEGTNHRIISFNVEKMTGYSQSFFQKRGTRMAYLATIENSEDKVLGVLVVEYSYWISGIDKTTRIIQTICKFSTKLRFLFN